MDSSGKWSNESQLWWTKGKPGDRLTLRLPVKEDGRYKLIVQMTKAVDYGIVQWSLDGKKLGEPLDLYNRGVIPTGPLELGLHDLTKGDHRLTLEIVGANEAGGQGLHGRPGLREVGARAVTAAGRDPL